MDQMYYSKPLKFWAIVGGGALALIIIVSLMIKYTTYTLTVTGESSYRVQHAAKNNPTKKFDTLQLFGFYFVPRSSAYLSVNTDAAETRIAIGTPPAFGAVHKDIALAPQRTVSKLGRESLGCTLSNSTGTYTHRCFEPDNIVLLSDLDSGRWENIPYTNAPADSLVSVPYKNGLLSLVKPIAIDPSSRVGIVGDDEAAAFDITSTELLAVYTAPGLFEDTFIPTGIVYKEDNKYALAADTSGGDGFAVHNLTDGKLRYFESPTASAKELSRTAAYAVNSDSASCSLNGSLLVCYYGTVSTAADEEDEVETRRNANKARGGAIGSIETYNLKEGKSSVSYVRSSGIDSICLSKEQGMIGLSGANALRITTEADKNVAVAILGDDVKHISCGDRALYGTAKAVYVVDGSKAALAFRTNHLDISTITAFGQNLIFNAFVATDKDQVSSTIAHTYRINLDTALSGKRLEDVLPYSTVGNLPIFDMDYNDNIIYIKPSVNVTSDRATGTTTVDEASLAEAEAAINAQLESDGVLSVGVPVVYSVD